MSLDPYGEDRADWHAAQVASMVATVAGKISTAPVSPSDILLRFEEPEEPLSVADKVRAGFARMMAAQNAGKS